MRWQSWYPTSLLFVVAVTIIGCTLGPDYVAPEAMKDTGYTSTPMPQTLASSKGHHDTTQHLTGNDVLTAQWWHVFQSPPLDAAVKEAIANNPDLNAARISLRDAHEALIAAQGALWPQIDVQGQTGREKQSFVQFGEYQSIPSFSLYSIGANVSYNVDIFGAIKSEVIASKALEDMQRDEVAAAYLTLTGNVIAEALTMAESREEMANTQEVIKADEQNLKILHDGARAGIFADRGPEILSMEAQLATDRALLPPIAQQMDIARNAEAVLIGRSPQNGTAPNLDFNNITLPADLPVSVPSKLTEQRPDIRAAEQQLRAANAAIGVAAANQLPNLDITAAFSYNALQAGQLFSPVGVVDSILGQLSAPVFHGGTLEAEREGAEDFYKAEIYRYQSTVLSAFRQVADVLKSLQHDAELTAGQHAAVLAAAKSLDASRKNLAAGTGGYIQVLDDTRQYHQAEVNYTRALGQRYQDTAQLFVAMGGGWWNDPKIFEVSETQPAKDKDKEAE